MTNAKLNPTAWNLLCNIIIIDPDGWDRSGFDAFMADWEKPITFDEYWDKMILSTTAGPLLDKEQMREMVWVKLRPDAVLVWPFDKAPEKYRNLSPHGGDEDWLAFIPLSLCGQPMLWMEAGTSFGCCDVSEHPVEGGVVKIGAHA